MQADQTQKKQALSRVVIELDIKLFQSITSEEPLFHDILNDINLGLNDVREILGIPGYLEVGIKSLEGELEQPRRFLGLSIDNEKCRYPDELLNRVFSYVTSLHSGLTAPKEEILSWLKRENETQENASKSDIIEFFNLLSVEIIKLKPSILFGPYQAEEYIDELDNYTSKLSNSNDRPIPDLKNLHDILSSVLDMRISIFDLKKVLKVLQEATKTNAPNETVVERLIAELGSSQVEIQLPRDYLQKLTLTDTENAQDVFKIMRDGLFYEQGIRFPDYHFSINESLKPNSFAFKINHLTTLPKVGLSPESLLVNDTVDRLSLLNIEGIQSVNPMTGLEFSIIDNEYGDIAEMAGLTTWNQLGYFVLSFGAELKRHASCFIDLPIVEKNLNLLKEAFPALVNTAKETFSISQITQVLRALIAEEISIRNLRLILEQLINYSYIVVDSSRFIVFDDRLPLMKEPLDSTDEYVQNLSSFIRIGLKRQICNKLTMGGNTLTVYLLDPVIEQMISSSRNNGGGFSENKLDLLIKAVHDEVDNLLSYAQVPSILTTSDVRPIFHSIISQEFPRLRVVSYNELSYDLNIQPIARISLEV